jgi:hypothetical protein
MTRKATIHTAIFNPQSPKSRAADSDYDPETAYYYTAQTAASGAGDMKLYTDQARAQLSGTFTWPEAAWAGNVLNTYPATLNMTFQITAGDLAGNDGKLSITRNYADIDQGTIHIELHTTQGERVEADFTFDGEIVEGDQAGWFPDGSSYTQNYEPGDDGMWSETIYTDGSHSTVEWDDTGTSEQYYYDSSGNEYMSGVYENYGDIDVTFYDDTDVYIDDTDYDSYDDWDNYDDSQWYDDSDYSGGSDGSDEDYKRRSVKRSRKAHTHKLASHRGMKFEAVKATRGSRKAAHK